MTDTIEHATAETLYVAAVLEAASLRNLKGVVPTPDEAEELRKADEACREWGFIPAHSVAHHHDALGGVVWVEKEWQEL